MATRPVLPDTRSRTRRRTPQQGASRVVTTRGAALAALVGLLVGACQAGPSSVDSTTAQDSRPAAGLLADELCEGSSISCGFAGSEGIRYAVVPSTAESDAPTTGLVLVEPGGPGLDLATSVEAARALTQGLATDLLVLAEPWTERQPAARCADAVESLFTTDVTTALDPACLKAQELPASAYVATVAAVEAATGREVTGLLAASWGATRARPLLDVRPELPRVLLTPAPLDGTTADRVLSGRVEALPAWLAEAEGVTLDDVLAALGAAYDPEDFHQLLPALRGPRSTEIVSEVRRRAMAATYRYGDGTMLPNYLGYLAGFCAAYPGGAEHSSSPALRVLLTIHPCPVGSQPPQPPPPQVETAPAQVGPGCVVADTADLVTPASIASTWAERGYGTLRTYRSGTHGQVPPDWSETIRSVIAGGACET